MGVFLVMLLLAATPDQKADQKAIEELHKKDVTATKVYDVEALTALLTEDIVSMPPGTPPVVGKKANRELLLVGEQASKQVDIVEYDQKWEELKFLGDYAYEWGIFYSVVRQKSGGPTMKSEFRVMRILKRQEDGSWKVHRSIWNSAPPPEQAPPKQALPNGTVVLPPPKRP